MLRPGSEISFKSHERGRQWAKDFFDTMLEYRWQTTNDGLIFLGWVVTSLIGGALPFRPAVWIVSRADSGKTFLSDPVLHALAGPALTIMSGITEAGVAEEMMDHSLPLWLDEFEPTSGFEDRYRQALLLIRQATSGRGMRARAGQRKVLNVVPRFSVMATSIEQIALREADQSRFATIALARKGLEPDAWVDLEKRIRQCITPRRSSAIRAEIIENTPEIVQSAEDWRRKYALNLNIAQRSVLNFSALSAGASFLAGEDVQIQPNTLSVSDELRPFEIVLTTPLPFSLGALRSISILDALDPVVNGDQDLSKVDAMSEFLGQHGVAWHSESMMVLFAYTSESLKNVLRHSDFRSINVTRYFLKLPCGRRVETRMSVGKRESAVRRGSAYGNEKAGLPRHY